MATDTSRHSRLPVQTAIRMISDFATGLHGTSPDDLMSLTPIGICSNMLKMIRARYPRLGKLITTVAPFAILLLAFVRIIRASGLLGWPLERLRTWLTARMTVPSFHPLNNVVKRWMINQGMKKDATTLTLQDTRRTQYYWDDDDDDDDDTESGAPRTIRKKTNVLECEPDSGVYTFSFNGRNISFDIHCKTFEEAGGNGQVVRVANECHPKEIVISCQRFSGGMSLIQNFLAHIEAKHAASQQSRTTVFRPHFEEGEVKWDQGVSRSSRPLDSVTLADDKKLPLVSDIESYLSKETELFYGNRGIPLRRGYLFHGPPGTGKTSFASAIAGKFSLDVYLVSLTTPGIDDKALTTLFDAVPTQCVVLLEDIDSAGIHRETMKKPLKRKKGKKSKDDDADTTAHISLSGILNVIDGPASRDGRIVIMSSNTPDSLDSALVRPGRIDMKVYFGNASTEVLDKMFRHIFTKTTEETAKSDEQQTILNNEQLSELAQRFAASIPSEQLSPAEVQGYLMVHRHDPVIAVEKAKAWADDVMSTKARGANVSVPESDAVAGDEPLSSDDEHADSSDTEDETRSPSSPETSVDEHDDHER